MESKTTPRQYRRQLIDVPVSGSLPINEVRTLLKIKTRDTINAHLKALGYFGERFLTWEQIKDVLGLNLWIWSNFGDRNRSQYIALKQAGLAEKALLINGIDLDKELEKLKDEHRNKWTRTAG